MGISSPDDTRHRYDLGVLFVHGMGDQRKGTTLLHLATPILRFLLDWGNPPRGQGSANTDASRTSMQDTSIGGSTFTHRIRQTDLRERKENPTKTPWPESVVDITGPDGVTRTWLLREAWWADTFPTPGFASVAKWGLGFGPRMIVSQFEGARGNLLRGWPQWGRFAVAVPMVILFEVLIVFLLGFGWIRPLQPAIASLILTLTGSFGDVLTYNQPTLAQAAIQSTVREAFDDLRGQSKRTIVVAHSLGTMIAYDMLFTEDPAVTADGQYTTGHFISFGAAIRKSIICRRIMREDVRMTFAAFLSTGGTLALLGAGILLLPSVITAMDAFWRWSNHGPLRAWQALWSWIGNPSILDVFTQAPGNATLLTVFLIGSWLAILRLGLWDNHVFPTTAPTVLRLLVHLVAPIGMGIAALSAWLILERRDSWPDWRIIGFVLIVLGFLTFSAREWYFRDGRPDGETPFGMNSWVIYATTILAAAALFAGDSRTASAIPLLLIGLIGTLSVIRVPFGSEPIDEALPQTRLYPQAWTDFAGTHDPVPYRDPANDSPTAFPRIHLIHNQDSAMSDHTTYPENIEEFVVPVTTILLAESGWNAEANALTSNAATIASQAARSFRVRCRATAGNVLTVAIILAPLVFGAAALERIGRALHASLSWPIGLLTPESMSQTIEDAFSSPYGGLIILAVGGYLLYRYVLLVVWRLWDLAAYRALTINLSRNSTPHATSRRYQLGYLIAVLAFIAIYGGTWWWLRDLPLLSL